MHRGNLKDQLRPPTREAEVSAAAGARPPLPLLPLPPLGQARSPLLLPVVLRAGTRLLAIKETAEEEEGTEPGVVAGTNRRKDREGTVELRLAKRLRT